MRWLNWYHTGTSHLLRDDGSTVCGKQGLQHHRTTEHPAFTVCRACYTECPG